MKYTSVRKGLFLRRPNRFTAHILLDGQEETVHVKNTGRCREILRENTPVLLETGTNPLRKTRYSLVGAYKGQMLINIDSQSPNTVVYEAIKSGRLKEFHPPLLLRKEVGFGNSRFDIYLETPSQKVFIEVKGVTLEENGIAMFPDAPTERGAKHLYELIKAVEAGYSSYVFFLVQLKGAKLFTPNSKTDPAFCEALRAAHKNGVGILAYDSIVTEDSILLGDPVEVVL